MQATREKSTTADELAHVTGGYSFNRWNDYRMHPENGNLTQRLQALPAWLGDYTFPKLGGPAWRGANVWQTGHQFFYELGNDAGRLLGGARWVNSLFGAAVIVIVGGWAWRLFGPAGALVAVSFSALSPTLLAHSGLATSDMGMAFFLLAAASAWWWHLHDGRWRSWLLSAVTLGLAMVTKFTAVLLAPIFAVLLFIRWLAPAPFVLGDRTFNSRPAKLGTLAASAVSQGLVAGFIIWAFFGFRFSAFNPGLPPGEFNLSWDFLLTVGGLKATLVRSLRDWHLLPEGWLYGLVFVFKHAEARGAFLDGEHSLTGWVSFFPKAFLYKTTPALLLALVTGMLIVLARLRSAGWRRLRPYLYHTAPLLVLFVVYWAVSLPSKLNIGHRHILPTYPVLFIFCGVLGWAAARAWRQSRPAGATLAGLAALLLGGQAVSAIGTYPHFLAYFSPVVGGPTQGYKHLVDSSLDWGQDLPGLKHWLDQNRRPGEPVYLSYFGTGEPDYYSIEAVRLPGLFNFQRVHPWYWPEPGIYAISATMLSHVYSPYRGPWTEARERRYQELRVLDAAFRALKASPHGHPELMRETSPEAWAARWDEYNQLRFARLCHYLRVRPPDGNVGYSILLFRLSAAEIDAATGRSLAAWSSLIERTVIDQR